MLAFDTPQPFACVGRRNVSNVPAQALILMNDPQVHAWAAAWARHTLAQSPWATAAARVSAMYERAFGRPPTAGELAAAERFLDEQGADLGVPSDGRSSDVRLWADLAHALLNVKELIFID